MATVTILLAALLVGIASWVLLNAVALGLFKAESSVNVSRPATFVVAAAAGILGAGPTLLYWRAFQAARALHRAAT